MESPWALVWAQGVWESPWKRVGCGKAPQKRKPCQEENLGFWNTAQGHPSCPPGWVSASVYQWVMKAEILRGWGRGTRAPQVRVTLSTHSLWVLLHK